MSLWEGKVSTRPSQRRHFRCVCARLTVLHTVSSSFGEKRLGKFVPRGGGVLYYYLDTVYVIYDQGAVAVIRVHTYVYGMQLVYP